MDHIRSFLLPLVAVGLLAACSGLAGNGGSLWIAVPVQGMEIHLGEEVHLEGHTTDTGGTLSVEIWANEELLVTLSDLTPRGELLSFEFYWTPSTAGDYVIAVISYSGNEEALGSDSVLVHVIDAQMQTELPPAEETDEAGVCQPNVTAIMNANCRSGPEGVFEVIGFLLQGETALIEGRLADESWWLINNPDHSGQCWVARNVVEAVCLNDEITIVLPPPTPVIEDTTAPPIPTPVSPLGGASLACVAQVELIWDLLGDESGIVAHEVQLERSSDNVSWSPVGGSPWTIGEDISHFVSTECGWYYRWRVRVQDGAGNWSEFSAWATFQMPIT